MVEMGGVGVIYFLPTPIQIVLFIYIKQPVELLPGPSGVYLRGEKIPLNQ